MDQLKISMLFLFWEKVYYKHNDAAFPSDSNEKVGRFVGITENVGHDLTFKILTEDTNKVIYWSEIRSATKPNERNLRVDPIDDSSANIGFLVNYIYNDGGRVDSQIKNIEAQIK